MTLQLLIRFISHHEDKCVRYGIGRQGQRELLQYAADFSHVIAQSCPRVALLWGLPPRTVISGFRHRLIRAWLHQVACWKALFHRWSPSHAFVMKGGLCFLRPGWTEGCYACHEAYFHGRRQGTATWTAPFTYAVGFNRCSANCARSITLQLTAASNGLRSKCTGHGRKPCSVLLHNRCWWNGGCIGAMAPFFQRATAVFRRCGSTAIATPRKPRWWCGRGGNPQFAATPEVAEQWTASRVPYAWLFASVETQAPPWR